MQREIRLHFWKVSTIAQGLSGPVYRAYQRGSKTSVALKVLCHRSKVVQQYFFNEYQLLARLQSSGGHPHLAELVYTHLSTQPWMLATRYIDSLQPQELYEQHNPALVAQIIEHVACALDYLHHKHPDAPIIHRDVKPENILVDRRTGNATLIDLSIARSPFMRLSNEQLLGTPHYMAPEQYIGTEVPQSDQFALALVTLFYLTGNHAAIKTGLKHEHSIDRLHEYVQTHLVSNPHVQAIILRALNPLPAERFASCGDFATALRAALKQDGVIFNHFPWKPQRAGIPRSTLILFLLVCLALCGLVMIQVWTQQPLSYAATG